MHIIIEFAQSAPFFTRLGWQKVLESCGHTVQQWWPEKEPILSLPKADLLICNTYSIDRALDKYIRANPEMKVAMFGSNWGSLTDPIDIKKYPIVKVSEKEKNILGKLYQDIKKPDLVFIHITEKYLEPCMGGWRELGIHIGGILNGADLFVYHGVQPEEKFKSDVSLVSGYWPYKAVNLNKYIIPLCDEPDINTKIFGQGWNTPYCLGSLDFGEDAKAIASAKISPTISEPHSVDFGYDITERTFKAPICRSLCISDNVDFTGTGLEGLIPIYNNYSEFLDVIHYYLSQEDFRIELIRRQSRYILKHHTYFNRMSQLFESIGLLEESNKCINMKNRLFGVDSSAQT